MPAASSFPVLSQIDSTLQRLEQLARELRADPDRHVHRSAAELRHAFSARRAIEPAVTRVRHSLDMLRRSNREGTRREFQRRTPDIDHLEMIVDHDLLPRLRGIGFDL